MIKIKMQVEVPLNLHNISVINKIKTVDVHKTMKSFTESKTYTADDYKDAPKKNECSKL